MIRVVNRQESKEIIYLVISYLKTMLEDAEIFKKLRGRGGQEVLSFS